VRCLTTEELLITVNNFIERAPTTAKAIVENCDVLRERDVARGLIKVCPPLAGQAGGGACTQPRRAAAALPWQGLGC
jgi:hypothetical protein